MGRPLRRAMAVPATHVIIGTSPCLSTSRSGVAPFGWRRDGATGTAGCCGRRVRPGRGRPMTLGHPDNSHTSAVAIQHIGVTACRPAGPESHATGNRILSRTSAIQQGRRARVRRLRDRFPALLPATVHRPSPTSPPVASWRPVRPTGANGREGRDRRQDWRDCAARRRENRQFWHAPP